MSKNMVEHVLNRQLNRRVQLLPTVTVFSGPIGLGLSRWQKWARTRSLTIGQTSSTNEARMIQECFGGWARSRDLIADAVNWLARTTGVDDTDDLLRRVDGKSRFDFGHYWGTLDIDLRRPAAMLCRWLLECRVSGEPIGAGQSMADCFVEDDNPWVSVLFAITDLLPEEESPFLLLRPDADLVDLQSWFSAGAAALVRLATTSPRSSLGIVAPRHVVESYLAAEGPARTAAILREGLVVVEGLSEFELKARIAGVTIDVVPEATISWLVEQGASDELSEALATCVQNAFPARPSRKTTPAALLRGSFLKSSKRCRKLPGYSV